MNRKISLKRNILSNMSGQAVLMVLSLVSTHLVFHKLGADVLGVIYFSVTVTFVLITLSDMGLSPTVTREIAAHRLSDRRYVSDLVGSSAALARARCWVSTSKFARTTARPSRNTPWSSA